MNRGLNCSPLQVILGSGYNEQDATQRFVGDGLAASLQKPYRLRELRQKLGLILRSGRPPRPVDGSGRVPERGA